MSVRKHNQAQKNKDGFLENIKNKMSKLKDFVNEVCKSTREWIDSMHESMDDLVSEIGTSNENWSEELAREAGNKLGNITSKAKKHIPGEKKNEFIELFEDLYKFIISHIEHLFQNDKNKMQSITNSFKKGCKEGKLHASCESF